MKNSDDFFVLNPNSNEEWDKIGITNVKVKEVRPSAILFSGIHNKEGFVFKVSFNEENAKRESYIGNILSQKSPIEIRDMFIKSVGMIVSSFLPDSWKKELDSEAQSIISTVTKFFVIVQCQIEKASNLNEWLAGRTTPVSGEIIRAFMFQMVVALGVAQHQLGFVHNDLKLANVLVIPVENEQTKTYYINGDLFELTIPKGGFVPVILDFGSSLLNVSDDSDEWPEYLQPTASHTRYHTPFDRSVWTYRLKGRGMESDLMGLFVMELNLLMHKRRFGIGQQTWIHTQDGNFFTAIDNEKAVISPLVNALPFPTNFFGEDKLRITVEFLFHVTLAEALGVKFEFDNSDIDDPSGDYAVESKILKALIDPNSKFKNVLNTNVSQRVNVARKVDELLKNVFLVPGDAMAEFRYNYALSFFRLLFQPNATKRLEFGVPLYAKFNLSNALYHPFLSQEYWTQTGQKSSENIDLLEPLKYRKNAQKIVAEINQTLQKFDDIYTEATRVRSEMQIIGEKLGSMEIPSGEFDWTRIKDSFLIPVFLKMAQHPELEPLQAEINAQLIATPVEFMNPADQLEFLRKMGTVATTIHTKELAK